MKNLYIMSLIALVVFLSACVSVERNEHELSTPEQVIQKLIQGNKEYMESERNIANIPMKRRVDTAINGQTPYAVIITCSDSRVPPEHIFSAGIGDLFIIRTAGNVVDNFALGSIEYGIAHLGAKVIMIMGHDQCGAVSAALAGHIEGHITNIVDEIKSGIAGAVNTVEAERLNIAHTYNKIIESAIVKELLDLNEITVLQAKYELQTGNVTIF